jgi:hypothetical protein
MMGCKAERPTSNPFVTPKVGSILKLLTNDTQVGKIQSGKEELNGFKRVIWEIPVCISERKSIAISIKIL